ncbi:hypothetical protein LTS18_007658, partial [Coniosporium uncinatum]
MADLAVRPALGPSRDSVNRDAPKKSTKSPTARLDAESAVAKRRAAEAQRIYGRGQKINTKSVKDKKH